jgi:hypothetical protein
MRAPSIEVGRTSSKGRQGASPASPGTRGRMRARDLTLRCFQALIRTSVHVSEADELECHWVFNPTLLIGLKSDLQADHAGTLYDSWSDNKDHELK